MGSSATTLGVIDGELVMPFVLLSGLWLAVLWQVIHGFRRGLVTEFRRAPITGSRPLRDYDRRKEPIQFRLLMGFYLVVLTLIPVMMIVAATRRPDDPPVNPPSKDAFDRSP